MKNHVQLSLIALLIVVLGAVNVFGQATASGTIQGTVTDNSQAVVVGAQAVAANKETGASRTTTTDGTGSYRFELLPAGTMWSASQSPGLRNKCRTLRSL